MKHDEWLLSSPAARLLGMSAQGLHYLERTGRVSAERVNGVRIFRREEIARIAAERAAKKVDGRPAATSPPGGAQIRTIGQRE